MAWPVCHVGTVYRRSNLSCGQDAVLAGKSCETGIGVICAGTVAF